MGIEKFFNSIKKTYGSKIITKIEPKTFFPSKFFLIDFNSIIHTISQSISNSLCYLYHILLISNIKSDIYKINLIKIKSHIDNLTTDLILYANINIPDQSISTDSTNKFTEKIDLSELSIENLDKSFFDIITHNDNLDKYIIHKVATYVKTLTEIMPNLQYLYLAIDGVPLYGKMIEQRHRRTIGYIIEQINNKLLEIYKSELDVDPNININQDIYYNQYQFEMYIRKLKFNKSKISPATEFMTNLQLYISDYLGKNLKSNIQIELDPYMNMGEGEKRIVYKIHNLVESKKLLETESIIVYSPDADVILLMLLELKNTQVNIFRHNQQLNQLDLIDINQLAKIIIEYMYYENKSKSIQHNVISDIVMLITLLGNDFLPKIEAINTQKHIKNIFNSYTSLNIQDKFIFESDINWNLLLQFLQNLNLYINKYPANNFYKRKLEWKIEPDQIININAIPYFTHKFNIEHMANTYEPSINTNSSSTSINNSDTIERSTRKYIQGYIWLAKYYLQHNFDYKLFYYKYDIAPTFNQLITTVEQIIKYEKIKSKIYLNLEKSIPTIYFTPDTQLIYISSSNVTDIIDKNYLNNKYQKISDTFNDLFNKELDLQVKSDLINIYDYLDCSNAIFLNKCHIKYIKKISGRKALKYLSK